MTSVMPYDLDGNGQKKVSIAAYCVFSHDQIKALEAKNVKIDTSQNTSQMKLYQSHISNGMGSIYLLDPWMYEVLRDESNQPLQKLSDILGETPKGAMDDGFGVRLGDTDLYQNYEVLRVLPEDTVICLSRPYVVGKTSKEKIYLREKEMFAALVDAPLKENK